MSNKQPTSVVSQHLGKRRLINQQQQSRKTNRPPHSRHVVQNNICNLPPPTSLPLFTAQLPLLYAHKPPKINIWNNCSESLFARTRITNELKKLQNPIDDIIISCGPVDDNIFYCNAVFSGPQNTPYSNGRYHLLIDFPTSYPISAPRTRFDHEHCKCYHKDVDQSGNIISMDSMLNNNADWWNVTMGIKDLLMKVRNMLCYDNLSAIINPPSVDLKHQRHPPVPIEQSSFLVDHIIKACMYNHEFCHGPPVPIWLLELRHNNRDMLKITKEKHIKYIKILKSILVSNTRFCDIVIEEIIGYYGNQWHCGKLWLQFQNYYPLIQFIEHQCKKL